MQCWEHSMMEILLRSGLIRGSEGRYISVHNSRSSAFQAELSPAGMHIVLDGQELRCSLEPVSHPLLVCSATMHLC